ncbi:MAG TPA: TauD/TfdA family dioxygenase [Polyangiaceae bacterium]|nr:TauD/TfdA family dioxygenase [Polyangiaceae bacterium]
MTEGRAPGEIPGLRMEDVFSTRELPGGPLPLVLAPRRAMSRGAFLEALGGYGNELRDRMLRHGGLLFRGFPLESAKDFADAVSALATGPAVQYIGGDSPRTKIEGPVYTSTEAPRGVKIPLHNELSFVRDYPKNIFFYCDVAPKEHGETILGDARRVYREMDPAVRDRFVEKRIRYVSCYFGESLLMDLVNALQPSHKSWKAVFETEDRAEVERLCREHDFTFEWHGDWIRISQTRPATLEHPVTGETVWFSQPHLYDFNPRLLGGWRWVGAKLFYARRHTRLHEVFHADGSKVRREDLYHLMDVLDRATVAFPWERGDFLVLDNVLTMHGRATFSSPRRILAAMTS